ncbi:2-succinyl-5-enolpyruvyl-6-hydroxy-3-cyclohexene-1-carboxylic-acid synthase [Niallia sp. Krafla_26]|uniref:2-succinyl-5-enolpyruvyl-6-hydroxy-3- cyclohexene-1-carboxylic-acid synthase n=1 Tax=Niallia sp. Krafla_26 TaxID=3064703 RepID=UPI003D17F1B2
MDHRKALTTYIASFVSELARSGVIDVVVSPGSRSTPIAMVLAEHPALKLHIQVDERSAAFYALGIAKTTRKPTVLLCTSGTAAANYYPAIVEANISRIPLVVLTADRPHELRDVGAPQTIDQIHLYGNQVKWFMEMAPPEGTPEMLRYARVVCARAISTASGTPAGPVHLNFPLREPLIPQIENEGLFNQDVSEEGLVEIQRATLALQETEYNHYRDKLNAIDKGIIICGGIEEDGFPEAVISLAKKLHFPIIADPLSQLRSGTHSGDLIIDAYDTFLRNEDIRSHLKPEIIIRFGSMPVSKHLTFFLKENHTAKQIVVDGGGGWRDPSLLSTDMVYCQETLFCKELDERIGQKQESSFSKKWIDVNKKAKELIRVMDEQPFLSEAKLYYQLVELLPENATIFVGNSMPIRDVDSFFHFNRKNIKIMANRGANGIDGTVSTALGAATKKQPFYLILGDLTFFHDLNGMVAAKLQEIDITILLVNNNGGGIFSFLPQYEHPKHFELLFGTPLDLDYSKAVEMYGGQFVSIQNWDQFKKEMIEDRTRSGLRVIEIVTNRDENVKQHRDLWKSVSQEIRNTLLGGK